MGPLHLLRAIEHHVMPVVALTVFVVGVLSVVVVVVDAQGPLLLA